MSEIVKNNLPHEVMFDVVWSFTGTVYPCRNDFEQIVQQYQSEIAGNDKWSADQVVLRAPNVRIVYTLHEGGGDLEQVVELDCDDGKAFTAGELLYKVHNSVVKKLRDLDHHFFEGLSLNSRPVVGKSPVYFMNLSS